MEHSLGKISAIHRYPVKSFRGESLQEAAVSRFGLYGDRSRAFLDEKSSVRHLTAKHVPKLLEYQAVCISEGDETSFPGVRVTAPDGRVYAWTDEELHTEMEQLSGRPLTPVTFTPQDELMGVDQAQLLIVTDASVRALEQMWGKSVDYLRFRPNIVLEQAEAVPFAEEDWIGRRIQMGEVVVEVYKKCKRCSMVNIDPGDYSIDSSLLKTLAASRQACFGVYAAVVETGVVQVGDVACLLG
ncbi:MOSC domain-containing protein [Brevibacillus borstelensis]|uniref:MOSC domain-containing protein n=1 Tax=Brevibacillus borstelensis TaxID=45462 RepID=UPI0030C63134